MTLHAICYEFIHENTTCVVKFVNNPGNPTHTILVTCEGIQLKQDETILQPTKDNAQYFLTLAFIEAFAERVLETKPYFFSLKPHNKNGNSNQSNRHNRTGSSCAK